MNENPLWQKSLDRGYITPDGNITDKGRRAANQRRQGFLDENLDITTKGRAYAMTRRETLDHPEEYKIRVKEGWDDQPIMTDIKTGFDAAKGIVTSGFGGLIEEGLDMWKLARMDEGPERDKFKSEVESKAALRNAHLLKGASINAEWITDKLENVFAPTYINKLRKGELFGDGKIEANRLRELAIAEWNEQDIGRTTAEILGPVADLIEFDEAAQQAQETLPQETADRMAAQGDAQAELFDPADAAIGLATAGVGYAAAKGIKARKIVANTRRARATAATQQRIQLAEQAKKAAKGNPTPELDATLAKEKTRLQRLTADPDNAQAFAAGNKAAAAVGKIPQKTLDRIGAGLEGVGQRLQKADDWIKGKLPEGASDAYGMVKGTIGAMGGVAAISNPVMAVPAAAAGLFSSGKIVENIGRFTRIVGNETLKKRSTIPFWQRVANAEQSMPALAHMIDLPAQPIAKAARAGAAATKAAAYSTAFETALAGEPSEWAQNFGENLFFGASGAAAGAVTPKTRADWQRASVNDAVNFRLDLDDENRGRFDRMSPDVQRAVGTYAAIFPSLNFRFTTEGASEFNPLDNTATINIKSRNPLAALVSHETMHYLGEAGLSQGVIGRLVGFPEAGQGGILRAADGTLDPHFEEFMEAYNARKLASGQMPIDIERAAEEYLAEHGTEQLLEGLADGSLQKKAARSEPNRLFRALVSEVVERSPVAQRFARHSGTLFDKQGQPVQGTGILRTGIRRIPQVSKLTDQFLDKQAGRRSISQEKAEKLAKMKPEEYLGNNAITDQYWAALKTDDEGKPIYKDGLPELMSKGEAMEKASVGLGILKEIREATATQQLPEGHVEPTPDGGARGSFLNKQFIDSLAAKGVLNRKQIALLRGLNQAIKGDTGQVFGMIYQAALETTKTGKKRYKPLDPTFRKEVPYMVEITQNGNVIIKTLSITKLAENVLKQSKSPTGKRLYNGDTAAIHQDVQTYLKNHQQGIDNAEALGKPKRDFINTLFGMMNKSQADANPAFANIPNPERNAVIRSRRLDRINETNPLTGSGKYHFNEEIYRKTLANQNPFLLPEPVWHGTPHKVDKFSTDKIGTGEGAQAYGWGLYFAGSKAVGEQYRINLAYDPDKQRINGRQINEEYSRFTTPTATPTDYQIAEGLERLMQHESPADVIEYFEEAGYDQAAIDYFRESEYESFGNLYKVHLKPEADELLDWDKPLSEQSERVREALRDTGLVEKLRNRKFPETPETNPRGLQIYNEAQYPVEGEGAKPRQASKLLHSAGIKGIKYLDGNSRNQGEGSHNYVIFDDSDIEILEENGKPVTKQTKEKLVKEMQGEQDGVE